MPNTYIEYSSSGTGANQLGQQVFSFSSLEYLNITDIKVKGWNGSVWQDLTLLSSYGDSSPTDGRKASDKTLKLSAIPSYNKIRLYRQTTSNALVDFVDGARLTESDLDTAYKQGLFVAQEVSEDAAAIGNTSTNNLSLTGTTIVTNLTANGTVQIPSGTDANHFYRKGTFTATLSGTGGTAGSVAGNTSSFQFVKIGNMCFINGSFTVTNAGSYSASLQLTGLPYTAENTGVSGFGIVLNRFSLNNGNTTGNTSASVNANTTTMSFNYSASGNNVPWTSLDLNTVFALGGWYQIA